MNDKKKKCEKEEFRNKEWPQYLVSTAACMGNISAGSMFGWMSPTYQNLKSGQNNIGQLSIDEIDWAVSILALSCSVSPILGIYLVDNIGRKKTIFFSGLLMISGWLCILLGSSLVLLYVARMIHGIGMGLIMSATPLYLSEISEVHIRGRLITMTAIGLASGIMLSSIAGPFLSYQGLAGICLVPPILLTLSFTVAPESPIYLAKTKNYGQIEKCLMFLRGQKDATRVEDEMKSTITYVQDRYSVSYKDTLREFKLRKTRMGFLIIFCLSFATHLSGIEPSTSYTELIFTELRSPLRPAYTVILYNGTSFVATIASCYFVDKINRRSLYTITSISGVISLLVVAIYFNVISGREAIETPLAWIPVVAMCVYRAALESGISPIQYVVPSEIFSPTFVGVANCVNISLSSITAFIAVFSFQKLGPAFGYHAPYYFYSVSLLVFFACAMFFLPETRHKPLAQIQNELDKKF